MAMGKKVIICDPILITCRSITLGSRVFIRNFARIEAVTNHGSDNYQPIIDIEDGVHIEQNLHLTCASSVRIKKNTAIAANVTISDIIHPYEDISLPSDKQKLIIKNVVIGEACKIYNNAVILPGTELGRHCIVGANTVVSAKKYPDYCVIIGSPSRIIKRYSASENKWAKTDENGNFIE